MNRDEIIEQAARVLAHLEPGEPWLTNESLGGGVTGTRDDEYRKEMIDQATELWDAGLLARPMDKIALDRMPDWRDAPAILATCLGCNEGGLASTTHLRLIGDQWYCTECMRVTNWRGLSDVTPLYPKEDA